MNVVASLIGAYCIGAIPTSYIAGKLGRGLVYLGGNTFRPAGAEAVRVRFTAAGDATLLTVHDPDLVLTARRSQP